MFSTTYQLLPFSQQLPAALQMVYSVSRLFSVSTNSPSSSEASVPASSQPSKVAGPVSANLSANQLRTFRRLSRVQSPASAYPEARTSDNSLVITLYGNWEGLAAADQSAHRHQLRQRITELFTASSLSSSLSRNVQIARDGAVALHTSTRAHPSFKTLPPPSPLHK